MTSHDEEPIWIANWNHAGGPLLLGLVICPLVALGGIWVAASGRLNDSATDEPSRGGFTVVIVPVVAALGWMLYSLTFTTLWLRLGNDIALRSALRTKRRPWSDVKRIRFYNQKGRLTNDRMLLIEIDDYNEIEVQISSRLEQQVAELARRKGVEISLQSPGTEEMAEVASDDAALDNDEE